MAYTTIDDPSVYFQTALYSSDGGGGSISVTNDGNSNLQPDWIWIKVRNGSNNHNTFDTSRGVANRLKPNDTASEDGSSGVSVNSDGFATGTSLGDINNTSGANNYVAWQWKINGGTVANDTNGDITTSVQVNQTAGISIATYTGNGGSGQTLGHGLGAEAEFVIFKDRESTSAWRVYTKMTGASKFFNLDTAAAANTSSNIFPSSTSTVIGVEQNDVMNKNNSDFVMYSFRSIKGYSKIGSYKGNGNANGAFIYTGFKPAMVITKGSDVGDDWVILDNKRDPINAVTKRLFPAGADAESSTGNWMDFLSNGFKLGVSDTKYNGNDSTYIYLAFAESPFVSSKGVPTTAR
jgi:hypothetical protein